VDESVISGTFNLSKLRLLQLKKLTQVTFSPITNHSL